MTSYSANLAQSLLRAPGLSKAIAVTSSIRADCTFKVLIQEVFRRDSADTEPRNKSHSNLDNNICTNYKLEKNK